MSGKFRSKSFKENTNMMNILGLQALPTEKGSETLVGSTTSNDCPSSLSIGCA
jgi:hypothetical protein